MLLLLLTTHSHRKHDTKSEWIFLQKNSVQVARVRYVASILEAAERLSAIPARNKSRIFCKELLTDPTLDYWPVWKQSHALTLNATLLRTHIIAMLIKPDTRKILRMIGVDFRCHDLALWLPLVVRPLNHYLSETYSANPCFIACFWGSLQPLQWMGNLDLNQDQRSQSTLLYSYTIPQKHFFAIR